MAIAANRFPGIYAALAWRPEVAVLAKAHNNANILVLPAEYLDTTLVLAIVAAWVHTTFLNGRHAERIAQIDSHSKLV